MAKKKGGGLGPGRTVALIIALAVFAYAGYQLYSIFSVYYKSGREYSELADSFTHPNTSNGEKASSPGSGESGAEEAVSGPEFAATITAEKMLYEDAEPPLKVDFDELRAINPDVVGWIYVEALPEISYPVCKGEDNDYYLHHTFRREYLYAGSIFEDYHNAPDFSDPNTIVYGHNMKNGSMFNHLKKLKDQAFYDRAPYFWILTPDGNYRYHIYSVMTVSVDSEAYLLFGEGGENFLEWEKRLQKGSEVRNDLKLAADDKTVILSTCTSDDSYRDIIIGKCVSSQRPKDPAPTPIPTPEPDYDDGTVYLGDVVFGETYD